MVFIRRTVGVTGEVATALRVVKINVCHGIALSFTAVKERIHPGRGDQGSLTRGKGGGEPKAIFACTSNGALNVRAVCRGANQFCPLHGKQAE